MDLFQRIIECDDKEVDSIIETAINEANINADKVNVLGFENITAKSVFKGFIPLNTRIRYSNISLETYGMETTDFFYEFAHFIRKYNIKTKNALVNSLEYFVNAYFGMPGNINREDIFQSIAWQTTETDEDFFKALENNKIGDLKGKGAAECTERGALVQQILSIFGTESYYCMGCVEHGDKQDGHCFNIVKRQNDYALLDYSIPIVSYKEDGKFNTYYPFVGSLTNEEFQDFINTGVLKSFDDYYILNKQYVKTNMKRTYVVGKFEIEKENKSGIGL
jgi:hypothetical protein